MSLETAPETSVRMSKVRQRDTAPELAVRKWLTQRGLRFRLHGRDLPGSPDIVNRSKKWAIFVHGCFWHGHPGCKASKLPTANRKFWSDKIDANMLRDGAKTAALRALGFRVCVVWECEVKALARTGRPPVRVERFVRRALAATCRPIKSPL